MFFESTKRWDILKMINSIIPRTNGVREETIQLSECFAPYSMKRIAIILTVQRSAEWRQFVFEIRRSLVTQYLVCLCTDDQIRIPSSIRHTVWSDLNPAMRQ